ncbi:single-stranded DNA-binding protein [Pseudomonas sp. R-28-1W-6]|uniref:single-stranded DNA-binding protein n=1 Tax=Pseudomonas sp. R-28-1W-6 TaxID=2650101 RepID=UPI0013661B78|nr:single-stranded DNA-binding protein [Pseudomonas sp. R-28-1W-6]MWV14206.1 single-stranded DNA-binding protein [Pseudomonas sp. R-28-1W-6]
MNKMIALGTLTKDAVITDLESGRQRLGGTLAVKEGMTGDKPIMSYVAFASFGPKGFADEIVKTMKEGEAFSVFGKLNKTPSEKDSNVYDNATIEVRLGNIRPAGKGGLGLNRITLIGNVTGDARLNSVNDETDVVNFTVATNDGYRNEAGEWIDNPPVFHECSRFVKKGSGAKLQEKLMKGREVEVEGTLRYTKSTSKTNNKTYHAHVIRAEEVIPGRKPQGKVEDQAMPAEQQLPQDVIDQQQAGDDIPF